MRDAVSTIFTCKNQVFIIKRSKQLRSFPGYIAFIGGKVDEEDSIEIEALKPLYENQQIKLINTLYREVKEETGVDLLKINKIKLDYLGNIASPEFNPIRFNTFFYKIELDELPSMKLDDNEIEWGRWQRPVELLEEWRAGQHLIIPPIRFYLEELAGDITKVDLRYNRVFEEDKVPFFESINELTQYMPLSNTLPPADRTNAFLIQGDKNTLIDPSPKDESEYQKLVSSLAQVDQILITHYHYDHYQFTDRLAQQLRVPVLLTEDTCDLILEHRGRDYFDRVRVEIVKEQDVICSWKKKKVRVYEVSGHARGHIALAPESMEWFIAGDLFQGVGSVVVGGKNASMAKYMQSLQRVIDLDPACVIPSHGIALGGTGIIAKNLKHRMMREEQVLKLSNKYSDIEEVYEYIYAGLSEKLRPYAMANIQAHKDKLILEGKLKA